MGLIAAVEPNAAHGGVLHPNKWRPAGCARGDYEEESRWAAEIRPISPRAATRCRGRSNGPGLRRAAGPPSSAWPRCSGRLGRRLRTGRAAADDHRPGLFACPRGGDRRRARRVAVGPRDGPPSSTRR